MARLYRTPTDKRLQALNNRARRKAKYHLEKSGIQLDAPTVSPVGMSGAQKLAAIRRLESFMTVRPIAGARGKPIDKSLFNQYKKLESKLNDRNFLAVEKYADIQHTPDQSIGQYNFTRYGSKESFDFYKDKKGRRMGKSGEYAPKNKSARAFLSDTGLAKEIKKVQNQIKGTEARSSWKTNKKRIEKLLVGTADENLIPRVSKLTLHQRNVLFNLTPFMSVIAFIHYEDESDRDNDVLVHSARSRVESIIDSIEGNVAIRESPVRKDQYFTRSDIKKLNKMISDNPEYGSGAYLNKLSVEGLQQFGFSRGAAQLFKSGKLLSKNDLNVVSNQSIPLLDKLSVKGLQQFGMSRNGARIWYNKGKL